MKKKIVNKYLNQEISSCWVSSPWPSKIMDQHKQLHIEINTLHEMLQQDELVLLQVEARLKKLIKGVIVHLELESCFIAPILEAKGVSFQKKTNLKHCFKDIYKLSHETTDYIQALKLAQGPLTQEHINHISHFLNTITSRLIDEDILYSTMNKK